jgi:pimeloyl-ACP methyl ester carboxylesterase
MKLDVGGAEIRYEDEGEGTALLFLHAFPLGLFMWDPQVPAFRGRNRVVRFDVRGLGGTPPEAGPLAMERIADDAASLLDRLGIHRAVVVGCSMGGYAALAFASRHPARLLGLVLQDTRAVPDDDAARRNRAALAERVLAEGSAVAADAFLPKLLGATTQRERPDLATRLREAILRQPPRGLAHALLGLGSRPDSRPTLGAIRVPTLIVCGEEDVLTPPAEAEAMHRGVPGSRLVILPLAGHLSSLEQPEAFNAALAAFLDETAV